jgi:hypothetical protein
VKLSEHFSLLIEERKVLRYLLSITHPLGREKAAVFGALGFGADNWVSFADGLRRIAATSPAYLVQDNEYGRKYLVCGSLVGPMGKEIVLNTVWIVAAGERIARLVTAYPRGK